MQEHFSQFTPHTDAYITKVNELTSALKEHKSELDIVMSATLEEARIHKDMTEKAYLTRLVEEKNLREVTEGITKAKQDHESWIKEKDAMISRKEAEYSEVEAKCKSLDTKANSLIGEIKNYTNKIEELAPQLSTIERGMASLKLDWKKMIDAVEALKQEEAILKGSIEGSKKTLSNLQEEIKIVNSR